jgi:ABC-type multidrug transport system fused ATPase/permease subunit
MTVTRAYLRAARYYRDDLARVILSTLLIGVSTLAELAQPFPLAIMIDCVLKSGQPSHWIYRLFFRVAPTGKLQQIVLLAGLMLGLRLIQELVGMWNGVYKIKIGYSGLLHVRSELYRKLQQLSLSYHRSHPQGETMYRLGTDTNAFQAAFNIVQTIFVNIIKLALMSCIMLAMNWKLALIAMAMMPILFITIHTYGRVILTTATRASQIEAHLTTIIQRSVASIGLVLAFGREDDEYDRFNKSVRESHGAWASMHIHSMIYWFIMGMTFALGLALVTGYGGYLVLQGNAAAALGHEAPKDALTIGFLWTFIQLLTTQLYDPLFKLSGSGSDMRRYMAGLVRVYEILDTPATITDAPNAIELPKQPRTLELRNLSFYYRDDNPVLRELNAEVLPGQMVAFVGSSGVGKSSLLNLLPRFYDPTDGSIMLDKHDLRTVKLKSLRRHISLVLQENAILAASVRDNIAYGRPDASMEDIHRAAEEAGAADFIESLPQKYDTILDEAGQNLSGGQRQRISIARALATQAPILVLDEPTSALDAHNELMITQTLVALKGKRTIILVSHRLSTVADCDRIYVMDAGRVVEQGTHEELLLHRGHYYQMARHQMKLVDTEAPALVPAPSTTGEG